MGDTVSIQVFSDTLGHYAVSVGPGVYALCAAFEGYQTSCLADSLWIEDGLSYDSIDFILHEVYVPACYVAARPYAEDMIRVSWSRRAPLLTEGFETGDFGRLNWKNAISTFPWAIDTTHAVEGLCCMKSTGEGQSEALSQIEVAVYVPTDGLMRFFSKVSSESPWDVGRFYIDGDKVLECSGEADWEMQQFPISEGEHVFRWSYQKDASSDIGGDCFYVDDIWFCYTDTTLRTDNQHSRSFSHYDLLRRRYEETPVVLASQLTDTVFMDLNWESLPWGKYQWGVCCHYDGNRAASDTVWSVYLDKEMTTTLEINASTNVGLPANGALVSLVSDSGRSYHGVLDSEGHAVLANVYRDDYSLSVSLDGYEDYVSTEPVSVFGPTHVDLELLEAIVPVDSLYVSATGWAVWELAEAPPRGLQYYEIRLDSQFVATTTERHFQLDVNQLAEGRSYLAEVRPVYLSDTCCWKAAEWVLGSCAAYEGVGQSLSWSIAEDAVVLSWQNPVSDSVMGAQVFRDGVFLAFVEGTSFTDNAVSMHGEATYCVRIVHDGPADGTLFAMSCAECVQATFPSQCAPPTKLEVESYWESDDNFGAIVSWGNRPEPVYQWLHYDDGQMLNTLGGSGDPVFFWSIRFDADTVAKYLDCSLKKVSLFDVAAGSYQLWIYMGGETEPRTLVYSQNMTLTGAYDWHEEELLPAVELVENEPVWIVVGQQGISRPAAVGADMGNPDGRWVFVEEKDGWTDMHTYNMFYTWMLRAFVSNRSGRLIQIGPDGFSLQNYNLYRSENQVDYQKIAIIPFVDGQEFYQYYDRLVGASDGCFYYRLSASYLSDDGETCESDYATLLDHPDQTAAIVCDPSVMMETTMETLTLHPNPANSVLTIEAGGLGHVAVFNVLGQRVMDFDAIADTIQIDLSNLQNGLYLLKVGTKKGQFTRRFVVMH